jgi:ethanolamine-phosphate phospho-lyase
MDEKGASYLDTRNNVAHVGHGNPYVVNAIQTQLSKLNTNTRYLHPNVVELARRLADKLPDPLEVVVFVNSGSEANDLALRLARAYTKSNNTIVVERAYHGHT